MSKQCIMCNQAEEQVPHMVEFGDEKYICNECTATLNRFFAQLNTPSLENPIEQDIETKKVYPKDIKEFLDQYVISQDDAKKVLATEIYAHHLRIKNPDKEIQKNNILMVGDSGSGKTLLVQTLAKFLDIPLVIADMTNITQHGYVGKDAESVLQQLVVAADNDIKKAEHGIILLDECDKLAKRNLTSSTDAAPSTEGAQTALLKIIEGAEVELKIEGSRNQQYINTKNILFIGAGAFFGLDKVIEKNHLSDNYGIGFSADVNKPELEELSDITDEDLIEYGFLPEFVGRFPCVVKLKKLSKEDFKHILLKPKNNIISQYQKLLELDGKELTFSDKTVDEIVEESYNSKRGARAIRGIVEKRMRDIIFNIDSNNELKIEV